MLLTHSFDDPNLNLSLEVFLREAVDTIGDNLVSVILFGSTVLGDISPGYGDIDFLAVLRDDPSESMLQQLIDLRKPLRSGRLGVYCHMLEGPFLPLSMLDSSSTGHTICWGTGGERHWDRNKLGWFVHRMISESGVVIYGEDVRYKLPQPTKSQLIEEARESIATARTHGKGGGIHSIDWLLLAARILAWLREDRLLSKTAAAHWALENAEGEWKQFLPKVRDLRKNPVLAQSAEFDVWLSELAAPIQEACDEVEDHLTSSERNGY